MRQLLCLPEAIQWATPYVYADDVKLIMSISSTKDCASLARDLDSIFDWCKQWKLFVNSEKSGIIEFSLRSGIFKSHDLLSGSGICPKRSYTDLGIIIRDDFSWKDHYQKCC